MTDRRLLAVRWSRSGCREWHDTGGDSLVWQQRPDGPASPAYWIGRRSAREDSQRFDTEIEALDYVLNEGLRELRDAARPELAGTP